MTRYKAGMRGVLVVLLFPLVLHPGVLALLGFIRTGRLYAIDVLPLIVLGLFAGLFVWGIVSAMQKAKVEYRRKLGACEACGYDLRAHTKGGRCPECGRPL